VRHQYSHRVDSEVQFYKYRFPILFFRDVLKATLITVCPYRWFTKQYT